MVLHGRALFPGFNVLKVDAHERFAGVQLARFAVESDTAPIINAVGGVGTLLDLDQHDTRVDCMYTPEGTKKVSPVKMGKR